MFRCCHRFADHFDDVIDPTSPRPIPDDAKELYPRWRFATIACGVKDAAGMRGWADKFLEAGYGSICLLQLMTGVHMYDNLPDFWEEEGAYTGFQAVVFFVLFFWFFGFPRL